MKRQLFLFCIFITASSIIIPKFFSHWQVKSFFSPGDINNLTKENYKVSPTEKHAIFPYHPDGTSDEELSYILINLDTGEQKEVFYTTFASWDVTSDPDWLDDEYIFFTRHCGTSCQGITLLNTHTNTIRNATLSYNFEPQQIPTTYFEDWFGQIHEFRHIVQNVHSEMVENKSYLIFDLIDDKGRESGQKRFLFTGASLILES